MTWTIVNKKYEAETSVLHNTLVTVGNTEECEILLENIKQPHIAGQIFFDEDFLFYGDHNRVESFFQEVELVFFEQKFLFQSTSKTVCFKNMPILEAEIMEVVQASFYKPLLLNIQKELSKKQNFINQGHANDIENVSILDIITTSCHFLDKIFWKERAFYNEQDREKFKKIIWCLWAQICAYGILTLAIADESVSEIMVNGAKNIYLERSGTLTPSHLSFSSGDELMTIIERICTSAGRRIDESIPFCDARLKDGSRVHAIIPPLALNGPCLTIRKFPKRDITMETLQEKNSIPPWLVNFLKEIVVEKKNILISGGTGSGKTTLLNCLSAFIPLQERILTMEDAAELKLQQPHVIRLECRNDNVEHKGNVNMRDLMRNALRMRPDRIIVGECRGGEALDMLQAMNTGHDGSMTTIHANSPVDALRRLETLVMFASSELPSRAIREQIAAAIHFVIQITRFPNGKRCVSSIQKLTGLCEITQKFITELIYEI